MAVGRVLCPECQQITVVKYGKQANGTQRYRCKNPHCARRIFLATYHDKGRSPEVKQQILHMTHNGHGVRAVARSLGVSSATVINILKKRHILPTAVADDVMN